MTLDEAIVHAEEVAQAADCEQCRQDHQQLAEWLKEFKRLKGPEEVMRYELPR